MNAWLSDDLTAGKEFAELDGSIDKRLCKRALTARDQNYRLELSPNWKCTGDGNLETTSVGESR